MATQAHCAYCFEVLVSSLERRKPLALGQVEELWAKYNEAPEEGEDGAPQDGVDGEDGHAEDEDEDMEDASDLEPAQGKPQNAAISRLLNTPSTGSSSSSTPSTASSTSLQTAASTPPPTSGRSFFSSFRRSKSTTQPTSSEDHPLFVTWSTVSRSGSKSLRGCIGTFEAQELSHGLASYAQISAFEDQRFTPITSRELPTLSVGVTLLTDFEPTRDPMDWILGTHGLRISFNYHGRRYGATYLPDVPREQGWTKEETMVSLMRKAGWTGRKDDWKTVPGLSVVRYQGHRVDLGYMDWREWRDWVDEELEA